MFDGDTRIVVGVGGSFLFYQKRIRTSGSRIKTDAITICCFSLPESLCGERSFKRAFLKRIFTLSRMLRFSGGALHRPLNRIVSGECLILPCNRFVQVTYCNSQKRDFAHVIDGLSIRHQLKCLVHNQRSLDTIL